MSVACSAFSPQKKCSNNGSKAGCPTLERCVVVFQGLPRAAKRIIVGLGDVVLCVIASWVAFGLRLGEIVSFSMPVTLVALASVFIAMPVFAYLALPRNLPSRW